MKGHNLKAAFAAISYLAIAIAWITYSDKLVWALEGLIEVQRRFATNKTIGFAFVTSVMLFFIVRRYVMRVSETRNEVLASQQNLIQHLAQAAEWRDDETGDHVQRVSIFAFEIAEEYGLSHESCDILRIGAKVHDIGKIGVPDNIVMFTGTYDADQRREMEAHTTIGGRILSGGSGELVEAARRIALCHHERWDGTGYPAGLKGGDIPIEARITAVADVFDALISHRR